MPQGPEASYVEGDITKTAITVALIDLTQLMKTQDHVITSYVIF